MLQHIADTAHATARLILLPPPCPCAWQVTQRAEWVKAFGDQQLAATAYGTDSLVVRQLPLGTIAVILPLLINLPRQIASISTPLLTLHGLEDVRVAADNSQLLHSRVASTDKTLILYEGMRHQLLQESGEHQPRVWADLLQWLDAHSGGSSSGSGGGKGAGQEQVESGGQA